jgi:hypothetical protein
MLDKALRARHLPFIINEMGLYKCKAHLIRGLFVNTRDTSNLACVLKVTLQKLTISTKKKGILQIVRYLTLL